MLFFLVIVTTYFYIMKFQMITINYISYSNFRFLNTKSQFFTFLCTCACVFALEFVCTLLGVFKRSLSSDANNSNQVKLYHNKDAHV